MEPVVLVVIFALLLLGPRRGGRPQRGMALAAGIALLGWFAITFGFGAIWNATFGEFPQP